MSKFLLSTFIVALSFFTAARAQEIHRVGTADERAAKITEWMKETLHLTQDQIGPVTEINRRYAQMMDDLTYSAGTHADKMHQAKANDHAKEAELQKIFTQDQFTAYKKKKAVLREQLKEQAEAAQGTRY
ncbi:hypothetical protein [Taibaiella soli]|uniref:DUF4890 domain-containing protein n=1 Tax=Taibaiella soli TaxID=1649169 RepID=A0A2W2BBY0_9BACT|nr:hypothetical protein [Taibaiella soli]PZF73397.1 hypothetical protein DN068_08375 [Taibaiella soli]